MIKIKEAIIVEGRYDKNKLSSLVDTVIIETNGFAVFKDKSKMNYIKKIANERGIIILTDSDNSGYMIRNHIKSFVPLSKIKQAFVKPVMGKEKRKSAPSAQGILGVEGMDSESIINAIQSANPVLMEKSEIKFTVADLFELGLTGGEGSREKRIELLKALDLPEQLNTKDLLKYMNSNYEKVAEILAL